MGNKGSSDLVLPFYEEIICWNQIFFYLIDTAWRRIKSFIFQLLWFMGRQRFTITWSKMSHHQKSSQKRKGTEVAVSGARCQGVWACIRTQRGGQRCPGGTGYRLGSSVRYCTGRPPSRLKTRPCNPRGLLWLFTLPQSVAGARAAVVVWPRWDMDGGD